MTAPPPESVAGGAKAELDGYEYQLCVSVLAALRLMLITKSASRITLEPANEEDLESDLEPATPGRVQPSANVADGYKLVVQVKLRNSGPWSITDFEALLKRGTTRRPAKHHLDDPGTRYLLIIAMLWKAEGSSLRYARGIPRESQPSFSGATERFYARARCRSAYRRAKLCLSAIGSPRPGGAQAGIDTDQLGQSIVDQTGRYLDPVVQTAAGRRFQRKRVIYGSLRSIQTALAILI